MISDVLVDIITHCFLVKLFFFFFFSHQSLLFQLAAPACCRSVLVAFQLRRSISVAFRGCEHRATWHALALCQGGALVKLKEREHQVGRCRSPCSIAVVYGVLIRRFFFFFFFKSKGEAALGKGRKRNNSLFSRLAVQCRKHLSTKLYSEH
jgi:hypothetical protein